MNTSSRKIKKVEEVLETGTKGLSKNSGDTVFFVEEIQRRAEVITPVLRQILENRPTSHWGIHN